jgi:hypothetical protein
MGLGKGSVATLHIVEDASHGPGQHHLRALDELGMQGLATGFQFNSLNRDASIGARVAQLIPDLILRIIE